MFDLERNTIGRLALRVGGMAVFAVKVPVELSSSVSKQRSILTPIAASAQARPLHCLSQPQLFHRSRGLSPRTAIATGAVRPDATRAIAPTGFRYPGAEPARAMQADVATNAKRDQPRPRVTLV